MKLEGGGEPQVCGWRIDRWAVGCQIVPALFDERMANPDPTRSKRVTDAMTEMVKVDIETLEKADCP